MSTGYKIPPSIPSHLVPVLLRFFEDGSYEEMAFDLDLTVRELDAAMTECRRLFPYFCWRLYRRDCPSKQRACEDKPRKLEWLNEQRQLEGKPPLAARRYCKTDGSWVLSIPGELRMWP